MTGQVQFREAIPVLVADLRNWNGYESLAHRKTFCLLALPLPRQQEDRRKIGQRQNTPQCQSGSRSAADGSSIPSPRRLRSRGLLPAHAARLGSPKAITATAHKLAKIVYNMLRFGKQYVDVGAEYYEKQYRERVLKNLAHRAAQFGLSLIPAIEDDAHHATSG